MSRARTLVILEERHTGERLELTRIRENGEVRLELRGPLLPLSGGPPLHIHFAEQEGGRVGYLAFLAQSNAGLRRFVLGLGGPFFASEELYHRILGTDLDRLDGAPVPEND